jgi:hypothetical protein
MEADIVIRRNVPTAAVSRYGKKVVIRQLIPAEPNLFLDLCLTRKFPGAVCATWHLYRAKHVLAVDTNDHSTQQQNVKCLLGFRIITVAVLRSLRESNSAPAGWERSTG